MSTSTDLTFENVTKFYGPVIGVNDVSLRVGPGITGLLGPNGAGKSTLMKLASGRLKPSLGEVRRLALAGARPRNGCSATVLTSMRSTKRCRPRIRGNDDASLRLRPRRARRRTQTALERTGMADRAQPPPERLQPWHAAKLHQARRPSPTIRACCCLDEPLTGIDPGGRAKSTTCVNAGRRRPTVLVSSHLLAEIEQSLRPLGRRRQRPHPAEGIPRRAAQPAERRTAHDPHRIAAGPECCGVVVELPDTTHVEVHGDAVTLRTHNAPAFFAELGRLVAAHRLEVNRLETLDAGAEAVFGYLQRSAT
jgi:ABC-2 type transport system ATP-binding protein